jgi:hypothetical protein
MTQQLKRDQRLMLMHFTSVRIHRNKSPSSFCTKSQTLIEMRGLSGTKKTDRKWILDTYAECIIAVRAPQNRDRGRGG